MAIYSPATHRAIPPTRLYVPTQIARLAEVGVKKFCIGNRTFETVMTIGKVAGCEALAESYIYQLADPKDLASSIDILVYSGYGSSTSPSEPSIRENGEWLFVVGKLKEINGRNVLHAYITRQITDIKEYQAFCMESILAQDFHSKQSLVPSSPSTPTSIAVRPGPSTSYQTPGTSTNTPERSFTTTASVNRTTTPISRMPKPLKRPAGNVLPQLPGKRSDPFEDDDFD